MADKLSASESVTDLSDHASLLVFFPRLRQTTRRPRSTLKGGEGSMKAKGDIPLAELKS